MSDFWFIPPSNFIARMIPDDRQALFDIATHVSFDRNQFVFQAGDPGRNVYLLADGRIKIFQASPAGRELILWFCFPGEIFGMSELPRSGCREIFAQTCAPSEVLSIEKEKFRAFILAHPQTGWLVIELLSCRLRVLGDVTFNLVADDVPSRIIKLILRLAARYGRRHGEDVQLEIPLTHQEMADMVGASRQTVTTVLNDLTRQGLIAVEHRQLHIRRRTFLEGLVSGAVVPTASAPRMMGAMPGE